MALEVIQKSTAGVTAETDASGNARVTFPGYTSAGAIAGGGPNQGPGMFVENDAGTINAVREMLSPEVDKDYRLRVAVDNLLDRERFNYTAQNTGKHSHNFITLTATMSPSGLLTNSGNITTTTTGMTFGTHAMFSVGGTETVACETSVAFTAQPNANTVIDFGLFMRGAANPFLPTDGVYFRMASTGMVGVINNNGVETTTSVFPLALGTGTYVYSNNATNRYLIQVNNVSTSFWINNLKMGEIATPVGASFPCTSQALPWSIRHSIVGGAAGAATQALVSDYRVYVRGPAYPDSMAQVGNRIHGSYQGLSGGTMGSLANYANSANPTPAIATNTTAALGTGLGGQFWETATIAVNTDGIICSYQNPAGTVSVPGRRLVIRGVSLMSYVQAAITGGPFIAQWSLAFGHTNVSLATAETGSFVTATTKAPRRVALPALTQAVVVTQAVSTMVSQPGGGSVTFDSPIYINPGEFVALVVKKIGTAATVGVIGHVVEFDSGWE